MDNLSNDNFGVEDVGKIVEGAKGLAKSVTDRAKAKKAQKTSDAGGYWQLRPYLKSLIPIPNYVVTMTSGQGITEAAIKNLPEQSAGTPNEIIIQALQLASGLQTPSKAPSTVAMEQAGKTLLNEDAAAATSQIKKALPYIIGAVVIGFIVYLISKK